MALAGLAAFSSAATALSSYGEAADVTDRLFVCFDSAVSTSCLLCPPFLLCLRYVNISVPSSVTTELVSFSACVSSH